MSRKYKNPRKPNIVSMRIADDEMESIQQIMEQTNKNASELMRDAFLMFRTQWQVAGTGRIFGQSEVARCS